MTLLVTFTPLHFASVGRARIMEGVKGCGA